MAENETKTIIIKINGEDAIVDLNEIKKALKETKDATDKIKDTNLGNFNSKLKELKDGFVAGEIGAKGLIQGVLGVGKAMITAFITNPVGIALLAIVGAVTLLYNVFKNFKPLIDKVEQSFAALGAAWEVFKSGILDFVTGNKSLTASFTGLGKSMNEAAKEASDLKKAEQELEDSAAALEIQNKKTETQIQQLLLQSKNRTLSEKERIALIDQATALETQQHELNLKQASENERITLNRLTLGKRLSDEELKQLREKGIAYARTLQNTHNVTDKEIEDWKNAILAKENLTQGSIALQEKAQNRRDALDEAVKAKAEKAAADAKAAAEKGKADFEKDFASGEALAKKEEEMNRLLAESNQKLFESETTRRLKEKGFSDQRVSEAEKEWEKFQEIHEIRGKFYNVQQIRDATLAATRPKEIKDLNEWRAHLVEFDTFETRLATNKLNREEETAMQEFNFQQESLKRVTDTAKKKKDTDINTANLQFKLLSDNLIKDETYTRELARLKQELDLKVTQSKIDFFTVEQTNIEKSKDLSTDYYFKLIEFEDRLKKIKEDNLRTNIQNQITDNERVIENGNKSFNERQFVLQQHLKLLDTEKVKSILTEQEIFEAKKYFNEKAKQLQSDENAYKLESAAKLVNSLQQTDQAATETAINLQKRRLQNGEINQKQFDAKVASIQKKAAQREKAYAVASTIISTAQAVAGMLTVKPVTPLNFALAAAAAALGAVQIAKILSTPLGENTSAAPGTGSISTPDTGTAPNTSFSFDKNATQPANQPIKTFVLSQDVTTSQQMERAVVFNGSV